MAGLRIRRITFSLPVSKRVCCASAHWPLGPATATADVGNSAACCKLANTCPVLPCHLSSVVLACSTMQGEFVHFAKLHCHVPIMYCDKSKGIVIPPQAMDHPDVYRLTCCLTVIQVHVVQCYVAHIGAPAPEEALLRRTSVHPEYTRNNRISAVAEAVHLSTESGVLTSQHWVVSRRSTLQRSYFH